MTNGAFRHFGLALALGLAGCGDDGDDDAAESEAEAEAESESESEGEIDVEAFAGEWSGGWQNTTFGSTGTATMTVTVAAAESEITLVLDLDGNVFGAADPPADTFTGPYDQNGFTVEAESATFGDIDLTIDAAGTITGTALPEAFHHVALGGTATVDEIVMTYDIYDPDDTTLFAQGTLTLTHD